MPQPSPDEREEEDGPHRTRVQVVVVVITVVLIAAGIWLAHVIADMRRVQDCLLTGRTNCAPVE